MNYFKKSFKLVGFFIVVSISLCALFIMFMLGIPFGMLQHNHQLSRFTRDFENIPLPSQTIQVGKTVSHVGLFFGNGNHCDFYVAKIVEANNSDIIYYYQNKFINPIDKEYNQRTMVPLIVKPLISAQVPAYIMRSYDEMGIKSMDKLKNNLFILYAEDGFYEADDIRCS